MEVIRGPVSIAHLLRDRNNWKRYLAWQDQCGHPVRAAVRYHVQRALMCRTPELGFSVLSCSGCGISRIVPHTCKSAFCTSCATARLQSWSDHLLSDLIEVPYWHLIFTIPYQLRPLIQDNRRACIAILYRCAADAILALTRGDPEPLSQAARERRAHTRQAPFTPGIHIVLHTFGSNLKWNPHLHAMITAGGLSDDRNRWITAAPRSLVSGIELATEWRLRVTRAITETHAATPLYCRRLHKDRRRRLNIHKMLGFLTRFKWRVRIGASLADHTAAIRYCARYSRRPAIGERRITRYDGRSVTYVAKDYRNGGKPKYYKCPVLAFIDRLVNHIPEKGAHCGRWYGLFAPRCKARSLAAARRALQQRRRKRRPKSRWADRVRALTKRDPNKCPRCGTTMTLTMRCFGNHASLALIAGVATAQDPIPAPRWVPTHHVNKHCA